MCEGVSMSVCGSVCESNCIEVRSGQVMSGWRGMIIGMGGVWK